MTDNDAGVHTLTCRVATVCAAMLVLAALTSACASTGAVPRPFPMPEAAPGTTAPGTAPGKAPSTAAPSTAAPVDAYALTGTALSLRGTPYRNGGSDRSGFDCSGFTQYVFAQYGLALPREVREQYRFGQPVAADHVAAGDLLFFSTTDPGVSHVAIALGGDEFVHAPSSSGVVRVERLRSSYWAPRFVGARRMN
jgi:cell wall-associated NlpC family hydrolase